MYLCWPGTIGPHSTIPPPISLFTISHSRDFRLLHRRNTCPGNYRYFPIRARRGGAVGRSCISSLSGYRRCASDWDGPRCILAGQGMSHRVHHDSWGNSLLFDIRPVSQILIVFLFIQSSIYSTNSLHSFILLLFEKYATLLEKQFSRRFDDVGLRILARPQLIPNISSRLSARMTTCPC